MPALSRTEVVVAAVLAVVAVVLGVRHMQARAVAERPAGIPAAGVHGDGGDARDGAAGGPSIAAAPPAPALVHVVGAVRRPGVYRLRAGARVRDAVRAAGGATRRADVHAVNLAAKLADAQQVVVPERAARAAAGATAAASPASAAGGAAGAATPAAPVSLGTATAEQLDGLDGIGPALAERIVEWRAQHGGFGSVEDLAQVPGIGPKRLEALRDAVVP